MNETFNLRNFFPPLLARTLSTAFFFRGKPFPIILPHKDLAKHKRHENSFVLQPMRKKMERKGKISMHGAEYKTPTTNEPKNKFQNQLQQQHKNPSEKNVYKYKLRIKQLLLKQVSNAMISYSSFSVVFCFRLVYILSGRFLHFSL